MPHWSAHRGLGASGAVAVSEVATPPAGMGAAIAVAAGSIAAPAARVVAVAARTRRRFQLLMTFLQILSGQDRGRSCRWWECFEELCEARSSSAVVAANRFEVIAAPINSVAPRRANVVPSGENPRVPTGGNGTADFPSRPRPDDQRGWYRPWSAGSTAGSTGAPISGQQRTAVVRNVEVGEDLFGQPLADPAGDPSAPKSHFGAGRPIALTRHCTGFPPFISSAQSEFGCILLRSSCGPATVIRIQPTPLTTQPKREQHPHVDALGSTWIGEIGIVGHRRRGAERGASRHGSAGAGPAGHAAGVTRLRARTAIAGTAARWPRTAG
jgi:hypothetical protein